MKKAFVYRKGALGDTLFFIPFLFTLRKNYHQILFAGNYLYRDIFYGIDFIKFLDADSKFVFDLLRGKEDIDDIEKFFIFSKSFDKIRENYLIFNPLSENDWVYTYPFKCTGLDFIYENIYLPVYYNHKIYEKIQRKKIILFHTGSGGIAKRWNTENYFLLEDYFKNKGYTVFYLLGETESNVLNLFKGRNILYNSSLMDIIFLLQYADGFVGVDSGPGHLAGLVGLNGFLLFGPSHANIYRPYKNLKIIKVSENVNDIKPIDVINNWEGIFEKR